jgi:predicted nucleic acid-binding protein
MNPHSFGSDALVIDASLAVRAVLPVAQDRSDALERIAGWHQSRIRLVAPEILLAEAVSVVRQATYARLITTQESQAAVEDLLRLGIEILPSDLELCQLALSWAGRLGQSKAYDSFYLALAERLGAELWTGDQRLVNAARQLGLIWVHGFNESSAGE